MSVFVAALVLSGSDLAESHWEKEFVVWIAGRDQSIFGLGTVGFDVDEIAWSAEGFTEQKAFVLHTIDAASEKRGWNLLSYQPPFAQEHLRRFRSLIERYRAEFVEADKEWNWQAKPEEFIKCPKHNVYLHAYGCVVCNDV